MLNDMRPEVKRRTRQNRRLTRRVTTVLLTIQLASCPSTV
jgi:hypothetical protein